jgi:hypothetical protein
MSRARCDIIYHQRGELKMDQQQLMDILTKILESQNELGENQEAINKKLDKIELLLENDLSKKINALNDTREGQKELSELAIAVRKKSKHLN